MCAPSRMSDPMMHSLTRSVNPRPSSSRFWLRSHLEIGQNLLSRGHDGWMASNENWLNQNRRPTGGTLNLGEAWSRSGFRRDDARTTETICVDYDDNDNDFSGLLPSFSSPSTSCSGVCVCVWGLLWSSKVCELARRILVHLPFGPINAGLFVELPDKSSVNIQSWTYWVTGWIKRCSGMWDQGMEDRWMFSQKEVRLLGGGL